MEEDGPREGGKEAKGHSQLDDVRQGGGPGGKTEKTGPSDALSLQWKKKKAWQGGTMSLRRPGDQNPQKRKHIGKSHPKYRGS